MKKFKIIFYLMLCAAFITSCENESMDSVEDSNLRLFESPTSPEKESYLENIEDKAINLRAPFVYAGQLCPGEVASGGTAIGTQLTFPVGGEFWYFEAEAGDAITFEVNRTNCNADPILHLWFGTDTDTALYFGSADDDVPPACTPDCEEAYGDPYVPGFVLPFTGTYTIGIFDWGLAPCLVGTATYDIEVSWNINIGGCDSGVVDQCIDDTSMNALLNIVEAGDYRNHGQFVRTVAHLVNGWYDAGLITLEEKDAIMECAGEANIPS